MAPLTPSRLGGTVQAAELPLMNGFRAKCHPNVRTDECPKAFCLVANVVIFGAMRESRVESGVPCPTRR